MPENKAAAIPGGLSLKTGGLMDYERVRRKLNETIGKGLLLKAIAQNTGMDAKELSKFKNTNYCLKRSEAEILERYLDNVVIPQTFIL